MKRPAALAFWLLVLCGVFFSAARAAGAGQRVRQTGTAAPNFTLPTPAGQSVTLRSLAGTPVMLNFWATWCPNCRAEMSQIAAFRRQEAGHVVVLGIDEQEPAPIVADFVARGGYGWTFLLDSGGAVAAAYDVQALPTSIFLDPHGVIRQRYVGPLTLGQMRAFLREAQ